MSQDIIQELRHAARKLIRELGILELNKTQTHNTPQHWHTLIEIHNEPNITIAKLSSLLLISYSSIFRIVNSLIKDGLVASESGIDRREKYLHITEKGLLEIKKINEFSNKKILGALEFLTHEDQKYIVDALNKYATALEKSRVNTDQIKVHTLSTSRAIRHQIITLIEDIQKNEFKLPVTNKMNACVLKAEAEFYYNRSYNFWYAVDHTGSIIGSAGLKKIDINNAEIKKFFVHHKYRGKGVAKKLMETLLKAALKHNFEYLYLGTVESLTAAQRFYEKYGFSRIAEKKLPAYFQKSPLDSIFFKKKI